MQNPGSTDTRKSFICTAREKSVETEVWSLNWSDDLSVGIPEIDREHQQFVALVNNLNRTIVDRMDLDKVRACMQALLDNAKADAAIENQVFSSYPDATDHIQIHQLMETRLQEIMDELNEDSTLYQWIEASLKIKKILVGHFLSEDMKIRDYCRS